MFLGGFFTVLVFWREVLTVWAVLANLDPDSAELSFDGAHLSSEFGPMAEIFPDAQCRQLGEYYSFHLGDKVNG